MGVNAFVNGRGCVGIVLITLLATSVTGLPAISLEEHDLKEGDGVLLECPVVSKPALGKDIVLFWTRTPSGSTPTNAAIKTSSLVPGYTVTLEDGVYRLEIDAAQYERDNGIFQCQGKEEGTGKTVFSKEHRVTILMPPGEPKISPSQPFAEENKPYNITCASQGGSPDPEIAWMKEGHEVASTLIYGGHRKAPTKAVLTVIPTKDDDRTEYTCVVGSKALPSGTHLDRKVTLRVTYAPTVTVEDEVLRVLQGDDVTLKCSAKSNPEARSIKWYRGGQLVSNSDRHMLKAVTPEDSNEYTCVAQNGIQPDGQATVRLDVLFAPRVRVPAEREASREERFSATCEVESNPEPSRIYWVRERGDFRQDGPVLSIEHITPEDAGAYYCVAEVTMVLSSMSKRNFESRVVRNATLQLNVRHAPGKSHILPLQPIAVAGKPFSLECLADPRGYPEPEYRWWREGNEHTVLSRRSNLTLVSVHESNEGVYYCQPKNVHGEGRIAQTRLSVNEAPTITVPLRSQVIRKSGDVAQQIACRARGKPKPLVTWTHNSQNISAVDQRFSVATTENSEGSDRRAVVVDSVLSFVEPLTANERGRYACHFSNGFGDDAESAMMLRVEHSPEVRHTYNRVAFDLGDTAYLECRMQAYPEPTFEWMYRSRILDSYNQYATNVTDNGGDIYTGLLSISRIKEDDYGDYTCRAYNQVGQDKKTIIKLVKRSQPDSPTDLVAIDTQDDRFTLAWKPGFNGGYSNTEYMINLSDESGREKNETCRQQIPCTVAGLESLSRYTVTVLAHNPRGFSAYSKPTVVLTKLAVKDMPIPVLAQYDATNGMVHISMNDLPPTTSLEHFVVRLEAYLVGENKWKIVREGITIDNGHSQVEVDPLAQRNVDPALLGKVRVMVCLQTNLTWCGEPRLAEPFNHETWISASAASSSLSTISTIVTVCVGLGLVCLLLVLLCCCWRRRSSNQQAEKKDYNSQLNAPAPNTVSQPPCYYDSMSKSGIVETAIDEPIKSNGAIPGAEEPVANGGFTHQQPQYLDHDPMYGTMMNTNDYYIGKQDPYSPYDPTPGYFGYPEEHGLNDGGIHYDVSGLPNPYGTTDDLLHTHYIGHPSSQLQQQQQQQQHLQQQLQQQQQLSQQALGDPQQQQQQQQAINCNESVDSVQTNGQRRVVREIIV